MRITPTFLHLFIALSMRGTAAFGDAQELHEITRRFSLYRGN